MDFGIGSGSVQLEALVHKKLVINLISVTPPTALAMKLEQNRLLHDNARSFERALNDCMDSPSDFDLPYSWFKQNFDPFDDGGALDRIAQILWGGDTGVHRTGNTAQ